MRKIGFGNGRRHLATSTLVVTGVLTLALAGCGSAAEPGAAPSGTPEVTVVPTEVPPTVPASEAGTGEPSVPATASPRRTAAPRPPAPARPAGTPKQPASYDPAEDITDLSARTSGLRLAAPVRGVRHGELTVTIRNEGPHPVWGLAFSVEVPESMTADGGDWAGCTPLRSRQAGFPAGAECEKGYLAPGQSRVFRLGMKSPAAKDGADSTVSRWLVDVWSAGKHGETYRDRGPDDNRWFFRVSRA